MASEGSRRNRSIFPGIASGHDSPNRIPCQESSSVQPQQGQQRLGRTPSPQRTFLLHDGPGCGVNSLTLSPLSVGCVSSWNWYRSRGETPRGRAASGIDRQSCLIAILSARCGGAKAQLVRALVTGLRQSCCTASIAGKEGWDRFDLKEGLDSLDGPRLAIDAEPQTGTARFGDAGDHRANAADVSRRAPVLPNRWGVRRGLPGRAA